MMTAKRDSAVVDALSELLGSTFILYLKTHGFHWNVTGPMFSSLHDLFEEQYTELWTAVDEIAERIRAVGAWAPGSNAALARLSTIGEEAGHPDATEMIRTLMADNEAVAASARTLIEAAESSNDYASEDLGVRRLEIHEKNAWMLRSHIE